MRGGLRKSDISNLKVGSSDSAQEDTPRGGKKRKKGTKGTSFLKVNRKFRDKNFYTKPHDEDIPGPGCQLYLEDKFSENMYDKILKDMVEGAKTGEFSFPGPKLEVQNLLNKINGAWRQSLDLIKKTNGEVDGYNASLSKSRLQSEP